jgi:hypothetical protein
LKNDHTLIGHLRRNLRLKEVAEQFNNDAGKLHGTGHRSATIGFDSRLVITDL